MTLSIYPNNGASSCFSACLLVLALVTLQGLRRAIRSVSLWLLAFTSLTVLAIVISLSMQFFQSDCSQNRIRYLMPLWPLTALLAGAGILRLAQRNRQVVTGLLVLWLILGVRLGTRKRFS